jgi:hypothetical protein
MLTVRCGNNIRAAECRVVKLRVEHNLKVTLFLIYKAVSLVNVFVTCDVIALNHEGCGWYSSAAQT